MAWTTPKNWAVNEVVTSANLNTHIRDNENWLANDKPRCRALRSSAQAITSGTDTAIALNAADAFDVGSMHDPVTNNTRVTIPTAGDGVFLYTGYFEMDPGAYTRVIYALRVNGTTNIARGLVNAPAGTGTTGSLSALINLVATDYVELIVNQNAGASVNVTVGALSACWQAF